MHDHPGPYHRTAPRRGCGPGPEQQHQRVVEALVVRHVTEGIRRDRLVGCRRTGRPLVGRPLVGRHPRHQRRLGRGVVVLRERDPHRPPRVVEAKGAALELPGRGGGLSRLRPSALPVALAPDALAGSLRAVLPIHPTGRLWRRCRFSLRPVPRHQLPRLPHAPVRRRLAQRSVSLRRCHLRQRLHQVQGQLPRRQSLGQTGQRLQIGCRAHPLPGRRRGDPALPGHPRHHRDGHRPRATPRPDRTRRCRSTAAGATPRSARTAGRSARRAPANGRPRRSSGTAACAAATGPPWLLEADEMSSCVNGRRIRAARPATRIRTGSAHRDRPPRCWIQTIGPLSVLPGMAV